MENCFTVEQIDDHTFAISEYKHWEQTHCYLLLGTARALLIDTGLGVENIRRVVESLTSLPLIVVTTHVHWDHIGGHWNFSNIGVHEAERDWLESKFPLPIQMVRSALSQGECDFPPGFFVENYRIYQGAPQFLIHDGDEIDLGGRKAEVLHTPGHSPGHCCFYEPEKGYLYSGDLVYMGSLDMFYPTTDPRSFRDSIHRIQKIDFERILPGHFQIAVPRDCVERIANALDQLDAAGKLEHGAGVFTFADFQIHL